MTDEQERALPSRCVALHVREEAPADTQVLSETAVAGADSKEGAQVKRIRHRKLSTVMVTLFRAEAEKHAALLPYAELVRQSGLAPGTVRQLMADFIREEREYRRNVSRVTDKCDLEALIAELPSGAH